MAQESWVRKYLQDRGVQDSDIGWNQSTKSVTVGGKDFYSSPTVRNGQSFAQTSDLDKAYTSYLNRQNQDRMVQNQSNLASQRSTLQDSMKNYLSMAQKGFDPSSIYDSPAYKASRREAEKNSILASRTGLQQAQDRGIGNSTTARLTSDRMAHSAFNDLNNRMIPQLQQQAYQQYQDQLNSYLQYQNMLQNNYNQAYGENRDLISDADAEAKRKSDYNWKIADMYSETYGIPVLPKDDIRNVQAQVAGRKTLNELDQQYKYDSMNMDNYWKQQDQQYQYANMNQENYWNQQDQNYRYANMAQDNYWKQQDQAMTEREFTLKEQEITKKLQEEKDSFVKDEVTGMMGALRSGQLTPQQAMSQIQQDARAGVYTAEQKAKLEKVLQDYYFTTPPAQGGSYGPPNLAGFPNKQGGGDKISAIISANEGSYSSVNANDNGALSIGKFQWHAGRAQELLKTIKKADPKTYASVLGGTGLDKEISFGANWGKRVLSKQESSLISKLLNTGVGQKVQNQIMARDLNGYMSVGRNLGIKDSGALAYFADLYNQSPKRAQQIAKRSNGSLASLHQQALKDPVMGQYKTRRNKTYQSALS